MDFCATYKSLTASKKPGSSVRFWVPPGGRELGLRTPAGPCGPQQRSSAPGPTSPLGSPPGSVPTAVFGGFEQSSGASSVTTPSVLAFCWLASA